MSEETVKFVHRFFTALNKRDEATLLDLIHPDAELRSLIQEVEGSFRGHDGVRAYLSDLYSTFPDWRIDVERIRELGGHAVVKVRARAAGIAGGASVDVTDWQAMTLRDGRATWWAFFRTEAEALQAAKRAT